MAANIGGPVMYNPEGAYYERHLGGFSEYLTKGILDVWLLKALGELPELECITLCDYATADGSASLYLIKSLIKSIRERFGDKKQVHVIYHDQPGNDFQPIYLRVSGLTAGADKDYLRADPNVFVTTCGASFYSQCLPDNTVSLGICSFATHYLTERPCTLQKTFWSRYGGDAKGNAVFAETAARDLETFYKMRAKELTSGGLLATSNLLFSQCKENEQFMHLFYTVAKSMVDDKLITKEEVEDMTPAVYYRTEEEFLSVLKGDDSVVRKYGLELVSHTTEQREYPVYTRWKLRRNEDPAAAAVDYGEEMAAIYKGFTYGPVISALASRGAEASSLADIYFSRLTDAFASSPDQFTMHSLVLHLLFRKQ